MALGNRKKPEQKRLCVSTSELCASSSHPFYERLNQLLEKDGFDEWLEELCRPYFSDRGRPSIPPGVYFRMLFVGYLEGLGSERAIAWRCGDSLSLKQFPGYELYKRTPDHSSLSVWRKRLSLAVFQQVFQRILSLIHRHGLGDSYCAGVDSTTIQANASMRRLRRKDSGKSYREYVNIETSWPFFTDLRCPVFNGFLPGG